MQALAERLDAAVAGSAVEAIDAIGFAALKSLLPDRNRIVGSRVLKVSRRGKYLVFMFESGSRLLVHLSTAGRVDLENPPRSTRPRGAVLRIELSNGHAVFVREHGHERRAAWWFLPPGEDGPLAALGPEPFTEEFAARIGSELSARRLHSLLRDQRFVAGIGRGYADDIVHRAGLSPLLPLSSLASPDRSRVVEAARSVLTAGLQSERRRTGGLSQARLGTVFTVHGHSGEPCPNCGEVLGKVSFDSLEITYCRLCQTNGRILKDRRMSRLLR